MRREPLAVAAVLVPFSVLVVVALVRGCGPADEERPAAPPLQTKVSEPQVKPPRPADLVASADAGAVLPPVDAGPALEPESAPPDELVAPVRAVTAEVKACVADNGAHLHGRVLVTVAFRPTRDGGFDGVTVETPFANPQLTACLEDVFDQLRFEPTGRETFAPARYTFVVEAP